MSKSSTIVEGIGTLAAIMAIVANLVSKWADDKKMDRKIEEQVNKALTNKRLSP